MTTVITVNSISWDGNVVAFSASWTTNFYSETKVLEVSVGGVVKTDVVGGVYSGGGSSQFNYSSTANSVDVVFKLWRLVDGVKNILVDGYVLTKPVTKPLPLPSAPVISSRVSSTLDPNNNAEIFFAPAANATQYSLEAYTPKYPQWLVAVPDTAMNIVNNEIVFPVALSVESGNYQYRVRAKNSSGYSAYSNVTTVTKTSTSYPNTQFTILYWDNTTRNFILTDANFAIFSARPSDPLFSITNVTDTNLSASSLNTVDTNINLKLATYGTSTVPATPVLSVTPIDKYNFILSWTGNVTDQFNLERATSILDYSSVFGDLQDTDNQINTNIPPVTETYYYRIRTKNNSGYSAYSNVITVINTEPTPEPPPPPPPTTTIPNAPILQMLTSSDPLAKLLKWNMDSTVTSYNIESSNPLTDPLWMSLTGDLTVGTDLGTNNDLGDQHWGIRVIMGTQDGLWKYRIRAKNSVGYSNYSNVVSYTISNNIPEPPPPTTDNKNLLSMVSKLFAMGTGLGLLVSKK